MSEKKNYLNNATFFKHLVESQRLGKVTDELSRDFMLLAERIVNRHNFVRYTFREDLISTGVLASLEAYNKFNVYNSLGLCVKNGIIKENKEDNTFSYKDNNGEIVTFGLGDIKDHRAEFNRLLNEYEEDHGALNDDYTCDPIEFNYVLHNSPFAYFTQTIFNSYIAYIKKEYNIRNIKAKLMVYDESNYINPDEGTAAAIKKIEDEKYGSIEKEALDLPGESSGGIEW